MIKLTVQAFALFIAISNISCASSENEAGTEMLVNDTQNLAAQPQPCPSLHYADKFEVAFVRKGACGTLKNVEFVIPYNGSCNGSEHTVNMDKYISTNTGKKCGAYPIYTYTRKQN